MTEPTITPELVEVGARAIAKHRTGREDLGQHLPHEAARFLSDAEWVLAAVAPLIDRAARADELHKLAHDVLKSPDPSATSEKSAAVKQFADAVTFRAESFEPPAPRHNPCCSSHGVPMSCAYYRRTHFVEVRPCCTDDAARLSAPTEEN